MEVDTLSPIAAKLKPLNLSSMEKSRDSFLGAWDAMFASFDMYDNCHPLSEYLMKDIAAYTRKSLDINKPICLLGLRFSRGMQTTEWMNRTADTINLPNYRSSVEDLLKYSESSNFLFPYRLWLWILMLSIAKPQIFIIQLTNFGIRKVL